MALKKCPRCELNYILDDGALCTVCREEVHGYAPREEPQLLCSVCGEEPALPGEDMCKACMRELRSIELAGTGEDDDAPEAVELDAEPVSSLDEIEALDGLDEDEAFDGEDDGDEDDDFLEERSALLEAQ